MGGGRCSVGTGDLQEPAGPVGDGEVDELAAGELEGFPAGGVECFDNLLCPGDFSAGGGEHLVQDVDLPGVDRRLAEEPERSGELGLIPQARRVVQLRVHAVDGGFDPGGPGGQHEM